jgi:hypothetical protein
MEGRLCLCSESRFMEVDVISLKLKLSLKESIA